jgi:hypothetical protein
MTMEGRLSKKGAENLGTPELAGKVVDYGDGSQFNTVSVSYRGEYLGRISKHRITSKPKGVFKRFFGN